MTDNKQTEKIWNVRIQLGAWHAAVPVKAATAQEAHRLALAVVIRATQE